MGRFSGVINRDFVETILKICVPFSILIFTYAVTAYLLWKIVLHRFISREWLAFGVLGLSIGFYLAIFVMSLFSLSGYREIEELFNACFFLPIVLASGPRSHEEMLFWQMFLAVTWAIFVLAVSTPFCVRTFRRFTRYEGTQLHPPRSEYEA